MNLLLKNQRTSVILKEQIEEELQNEDNYRSSILQLVNADQRALQKQQLRMKLQLKQKKILNKTRADSIYRPMLSNEI